MGVTSTEVVAILTEASLAVLFTLTQNLVGGGRPRVVAMTFMHSGEKRLSSVPVPAVTALTLGTGEREVNRVGPKRGQQIGHFVRVPPVGCRLVK